MIAFPAMLIQPAIKADIDVPLDCEEYDAHKYPRWHLFLNAQLGQPMPYPSCHWDNAKVIAEIPEDQIKTITFPDLQDKGFAIGYPDP